MSSHQRERQNSSLELHLDVGASFLQFAGDAGDGATGASSCHQHVHPTCRGECEVLSVLKLLGHLF